MTQKELLLITAPLFLLIVFIGVCISLAQKNKVFRQNEDEKALFLNDSLKKASISHRHDSILQTEGNKAIGNIYFGINKNTFKKQIKEFADSLKDSKGDARIGDFIFNEHDFTSDWDENKKYERHSASNYATFYRDSLFRLQLHSKSFVIYERDRGIYYDHNGAINGMALSLIEIFTKKYGEAKYDSRSYDGYINIDWRLKKPARTYSIAEWEIGHKNIEIYVWVIKDGVDQVQVIISFTDNKMITTINDRIKLKQEEEKAIEDSIRKHDNLINQEKIKGL